MKLTQYNIRWLLAVLLAVSLASFACGWYYPYGALEAGDICSVSDAAEYAGTASFTVRLDREYSGTIECKFIDPSLPYPGTDSAISFNAGLVNSRSIGTEFDPKLELCWMENDNQSCSFVTSIVESIPSLKQLRPLTSVNEYIELLGPQRGFSDGRTHGWLIFKIVDDDKIDVAEIFVHHDIGNGRNPRLVYWRGIIGNSKD